VLVKRAVGANSVAERNMNVEMTDDHDAGAAAACHQTQRSATEWEQRLAGNILKEVSRSFYLTLQMLPKRVRGPICLGYLLARTSDTIADTETVARDERLQFLERFRVTVNAATHCPSLQSDLIAQFQPLQSDPGETKLLDHTSEALCWLASVSDFEKHTTQTVLHEILNGQSKDCQRFGEPGALRFLNQTEDLEEYTYLVAGSVGEFWTRLCFHHWQKYTSESEEQMMVWARAYGRALQLVNILRDLPKDLRDGRCYLPKAELQAAGMPAGGAPDTAHLITVCKAWQARCREQLGEALNYCTAIRPLRLRYATALPMLLAYRTLSMIDNSEWFEREQGIKVSRHEVKTILKQALLANITTKRLRRYAEGLS